MALEQLTSDLSRISNWGRENMVVFKASKTQFLNLSTRHNLPHSTQTFICSQYSRCFFFFSRDIYIKRIFESGFEDFFMDSDSRILKLAGLRFGFESSEFGFRFETFHLQ
ncbi:UNVERIFIED_CONTAM: hypothetical protein RMT77_018584 [Armadillidium vulgare]